MQWTGGPWSLLALEALLDSRLRPLPGARWIADGLRTLQLPVVVVGDVSSTTRRILDGAAAETEVARAVDALAAAAERFGLGTVPWYLSVCPGDGGSLPQPSDAAVARVRDLWQLSTGIRDVWTTQVAVTASPVFGAFPSALAAHAHSQHCFLASGDPDAAIDISETELWSRSGFQWMGAAGLRSGPEADGWAVLQQFARRAAQW
ncbi:hypothetical protein SE17_36275 [Kouleothrix aurantiaca]|uniref:Uncharacterized protein n=1 Tax=Kouleothrix aurantiaca TaxID=186479 RepID=A0A0P9CRU3_9CHLR|nr:hypothetical protein SE17_36275 [Kouleothrix aurantiaca]